MASAYKKVLQKKSDADKNQNEDSVDKQENVDLSNENEQSDQDSQMDLGDEGLDAPVKVSYQMLNYLG